MVQRHDDSSTKLKFHVFRRCVWNVLEDYFFRVFHIPFENPLKNTILVVFNA